MLISPSLTGASSPFRWLTPRPSARTRSRRLRSVCSLASTSTESLLG
nr:MAG TPA: hypothetical protein [Caudoviricetes sp.]